MSCHVCGALGAEMHFGGFSCRACAAFFRRYFHSTKAILLCTCENRGEKSHPCRECRIEKCLKAGMTTDKIQHKREQHPKTIPHQIVSRDNPNISHVVSKWVNVQDKRSLLYGKRLDELTYYQMCLATKTDCQIMWKELEIAIPQLKHLARWDKEALLRNFQPKWSLLAAAIDFYKNRKAYESIRSEEEYSDMVVKFYTASVYADVVLEPEEIIRVFLPFLHFYGSMLAIPICGKNFDKVEYMALAMLILFDGAHTNISSDCSKLCHNIRNQILRELRAYHSNLESSGEMRFIETIDTVQLLEKGESKFQEELLLLEMYNVHIHEDYRLMMREHNY